MYVRTRTWFGFVVVASALFILASRFAFFEPLENAVFTVAQPVESGLRAATRPFADFVNDLSELNGLSDENQRLREENERMSAELARLREAERELRDVRQFEELRGARPGETFVSASVFAREANNVQDAIAVNRGASEGIREGMVVLTPQGTLVGSVTQVLDEIAWITLITDPTSAVSAVTQSARTPGVVAGSTDGTLTMDFVERTADVKEGDPVLTSGVGGNYPAGELIGQVVRVEQAPQELFQSVRVQPLADLSKLETVLILTSFVPQEPSEQ